MAATLLLGALALIGGAEAHIGAFAKGIDCENGTDPAHPNFNSNAAVDPLEDWWFENERRCDAVSPTPGVFLELSAQGSFTVGHANNQAFTSLSYGDKSVNQWPDEGTHPDNWNGGEVGEGCIQDGRYMHVQDEDHAHGRKHLVDDTWGQKAFLGDLQGRIARKSTHIDL